MSLLPADPVRRGRVKFALLIAVFAIPVAAGWIAYVSGWGSGTASNYGTLLAPQPMPAAPFAALRGKWVLVQIDRGACEAFCEQKLYYMRQARRAQGRQMNRVERLSIGSDNLLTDVVSASRLLRRHGRSGPGPERLRRFSRSSSLISRPLLRQSLAELSELAILTDDSELRERLRPIVRSRSWEVLQLNPRKDVFLLLDCHLAAGVLGGMDSGRAAAAVVIEEVARRVSDELTAIAIA